jgi:septum formation protein
MKGMDLVLASTSSYRRRLLERLGLPFRQLAPGIDEAARPGETPANLAGRLARAKAEAVAETCPESLVIGSDQVAALGRLVLGKPGTPERARQQLLAASGRRIEFHTGVALVAAHRRLSLSHVERFAVHFRTLSTAEVDAYIARDQPLDCAGSFKWEQLGIALFERMEGNDPTALEGLPLIALCRLLRQAGVDVLKR